MHYYQHNIADYRYAISRFSFLEQAIFHALIDLYLYEEAPIQPDVSAVAWKVGAKSNEEQRALETILANEFDLTDRGYESKFCEGIIAAYRAKSEKNREAANIGWEKRKQINGAEDATAMRPHATAMPITNKELGIRNEELKRIPSCPKPAVSDDDPPLFGVFWQAYPRKVRKDDAKKAFISINGAGNLDRILDALRWQSISPQWMRDGGKFIPLASKYLKSQKWLDEQGEQRTPHLTIPDDF